MDLASIERCLQKDRDTDIAKRFLRLDDPRGSKGLITTSGMANSDYSRHEIFEVPFFHKCWHHSLPQELKDQFKHMQSNFAMGILPSILRAWVAIDSDLFLWNFENNRDLAFYDAINNTILKVDIISPKADISWPPKLHSILVVATTVDIVLLGISFRDSSGKALPADCKDLRNANIYMMGNTPLFRLPLDGLNVTNIIATKNSRIFYSAEADLYELNYYRRDWIGGFACSKTNHSKSLINYLVPVFSIFHTKDEIRQLSIDDSRNLLFVLFKKGGIQLFDMGNDGLSLKKFSVMHREHLEHIAKETCNMSAELFYEIVQITTVPKEQSAIVNMIATTSKGVRVYFSCYPNDWLKKDKHRITPADWRPKNFRVIHIRFPPTIPFIDSINQDTQVYYSDISVDSALMASAPDGNDTNFWALSSSIFSLASNIFPEFCASLKIRGTIWNIARLRQTAFGTSNDCEAGKKLLSTNNPLILDQHLCSFEKVYFLTSQGIDVYQHYSPLETFRQILLNYGSETRQFRAFAANTDSTELCVMALALMCSEFPNDQDIKDMALRVFFSYGGEPTRFLSSTMEDASHSHSQLDGSLRGSSNLRNGHSLGIISPRTPLRASTPQDLYLNGTMETPNGHTKHQMASPMSSISIGAVDDHSIVAGTTVQNSPRHDALFTYFSRIIRDIWHKSLCYVRGTTVYSSLAPDEIDLITKILATFIRTIDEYSLATPHFHHQHPSSSFQQSPRTSRSVHDIGSMLEHEKNVMQRLRSLIGITSEILTLWNIMLEQDLNAIFSIIPANVQKCLLDWDLEMFIRDRNEVCAEIITSIIRLYIGDDAATAVVTDCLRQRCPSLFTIEDASVVKATENIYRAKNQMGAYKTELITESIIALKKSIQKLNLAQTCDLLLQVLSFDSIVELVLARAQRDDPSDLGLIVYKRRTSPEGPAGDAYRRRSDAYDVLIETLRLLHAIAISKNKGGTLPVLTSASIFASAPVALNGLSPTNAALERDTMIQRVIQSEDELANISLFRWMMTNGLSNQLLKQKCKFFESFLFSEIETHPNKANQCLELLWKYYEKNENYLEAAKVLADMASKGKIPLSQRITYFSQALICIRSAAETKSNIELKQEIQDKLDVAQIQQKAKILIESGTDLEQSDARITLDYLNHNLCDLTRLFNVAKQFRLAEIKLAVLHCAGEFDEQQVQDIWLELLNKELRNFSQNRTSQEAALKNIARTVLRLNKCYAASPRFVPFDFILRELLMFCLRNGPPTEWLFAFCREIEISYSRLVKAVSDYRANDPFWRQNQRAFNFSLELITHLVENCRNEAGTFSSTERNTLKQTALSLLANLQLDLQMASAWDTAPMIRNRLEILQVHINQILN